MAILHTYTDFIERVNELGFMELSHSLPGLASLGDETDPARWHSGDAETDPWQWKDRAAQDKALAYGCILGGHKGFVAPRMYALFYTACRPQVSMPDRWLAGELNQVTWQLWQLFQQRRDLNTSDVHKALGSASRVDSGLVQLQREYYLTMAGSRKKVAKNGQPYGWPATVFARVVDWAPESWLQPAGGLTRRAAAEEILAAAAALNPALDRAALAHALGV